MNTDEAAEKIKESLDAESEKKSTKILSFTVVMNQGGIRQLKVSEEYDLK